MLPSPQPARARLVALPSPTLAQADEGTLVRAAATGDPRATSVLWDRFSPVVRRMLRRTLGPHVEVDHLLQEVFVRVVRQLRSLPDSAQLKPFFVSVTARVLATELRRSRVRRLLRRGEPRLALTEEGAPRTVVALYRILDELDADARLAFTLRHLEGLPIAELASATDTSIASAKRRVARASAHVQAALSRDAAFSAYASSVGLGATP